MFMYVNVDPKLYQTLAAIYRNMGIWDAFSDASARESISGVWVLHVYFFKTVQQSACNGSGHGLAP